MLRPAAVQLALVVIVISTTLHAEDPAEIARIHLAAIGGRQRVDALRSYRATGRLLVGDQVSELTVIAARPNCLRVEIRHGGRVTIQSGDGKNAPWQTEFADGVTRVVTMAATAAEAFQSEAEFDDPLVGAHEYRCEFDDAGVMSMDGRSVRRLLVTQQLTHTFYLLIDPETYFVVARLDERRDTNPDTAIMVTRYSDVRPVGGVLLPHEITVLLNGQPVRRAIFDRIEPNVVLPSGVFTGPGDN